MLLPDNGGVLTVGWALTLAGALLVGLWGVTVALANSLAKSLYAKIAEMAADIKEIAKSHARLEGQHAHLAATVEGHSGRFDRVEEEIRDVRRRLSEGAHA